MNRGFGFGFRPSSTSVLLTIIFLTTFSGLSVWQVMRITEKQSRSELIQQANRKPPVSINAIAADILITRLYHRAVAEGQFKDDGCLIVENVIKDGQAGFYIYCLFKPALTERWLLVNMGWLRAGKSRLDLPDYSPRAGLQTISGFIKPPRSRPVIVAGDGVPDSEHSGLWNFFDFEYLQLQTGLDFFPIELQLTTEVDQLLQRDWSAFDSKVGMHIGYAIHWAIFALATLVLFLQFSLHRSTENEKDIATE